MKTIHARECSKMAMASRNEKRITHVIDGGKLMHWVSIGWVEVRPATKADKRKYPTVVRD